LKSRLNGKVNPPQEDEDGVVELVGGWLGGEEVLAKYEDEESEAPDSFKDVEGGEYGRNAFASVIGIVGNNPATSVLQATLISKTRHTKNRNINTP
jgi:hypothetical protein